MSSFQLILIFYHSFLHNSNETACVFHTHHMGWTIFGEPMRSTLLLDQEKQYKLCRDNANLLYLRPSESLLIPFKYDGLRVSAAAEERVESEAKVIIVFSYTVFFVPLVWSAT